MTRPIIYPEDETIALVQLTQGKFAVVDRADAAEIGRHDWCAIFARNTGTFYAVRRPAAIGGVRQKMLYMENAIKPQEPGFLNDHADLDTLNNRRANLRRATRAQNMQNQRLYANNTSGCKGVTYRDRHRKWLARISSNGQRVHLGYFDTKEQAIAARLAAQVVHHGEFARQ